MAFTITQFRESIGKKAGISRPNLFEVQINGAGAANIPTDGFTFQCKIATIPPSTLGVIEVPYFGRMIKIPGNRTFDNLSLTVINDASFSVRNGIESWMALYNEHEKNTSFVTDPNTLMAGIEIKHFNINKAPTGVWKFVNCFPVSLGEIGLDWGSNDTAEEFSIDFAYDYWTSTGSQTSGAGVGGPPSDYRLKDNIRLVQKATSEIPNLYFFTYKWDADTAYIGVMAQELLDTGYSSALHKNSDGYYSVDYTKLGFPMMKISKSANQLVL